MTPAEQIARLPRTAPDEGRPVSPDTIDKLRARYEAARAAGTPRGEWLINVAAQARHALAADGSSLGYHMGGETGQRTERRWHITAGLVAIVEAGAVDDDPAEAGRWVRAFVSAAVGSDEWPHFPALTTGAVVGAMNATEAATFHDLCERFAAGSVTVIVTDDGTYQAVA